MDFSGISGQYGLGLRTDTLATYALKYFSVYGTNSAKTNSQYAFRVDATNGNAKVKGSLNTWWLRWDVVKATSNTQVRVRVMVIRKGLVDPSKNADTSLGTLTN